MASTDAVFHDIYNLTTSTAQSFSRTVFFVYPWQVNIATTFPVAMLCAEGDTQFKPRESSTWLTSVNYSYSSFENNSLNLRRPTLWIGSEVQPLLKSSLTVISSVFIRMLHTTIAKRKNLLRQKNWLFAMSSHKSWQDEETEEEL